ncbi:hypothetical protein ACHAW6_005927 [Cyclotella cf. meneghiniana]
MEDATAPEEGKGNRLKLLFKNRSNDIECIKVRKGTQVRDMAKMYGLKKGIAIETLLFKFDGEEMDDYDTPESLGMADYDKIEVLIKENETNRMTIRIKDQFCWGIILSHNKSGEVTPLEVSKSTTMKTIFVRYCRKKGIDVHTVRFLVNGERMKDDDTVEGLEPEFENDDIQIDALLPQSGGSW